MDQPSLVFSSVCASSSAGYRCTSDLVLYCVCVFLPVSCCSGFPRSGCLFHWALQLNGCIEYGFIYFDNDKLSCCFFFLISFGFQFFLISSGNVFYLILKPVGSSLLLEALISSHLQFYDILTMLSLVAEDANACIVQIFSCSFVYLFFPQMFENFRDSFIF